MGKTINPIRTGIVLKTTPHKEQASIIKIFDADGIISVIVRGTHKINSKTRSLTQELTKISFLTTRNLQLVIPTLTDGEVVDQFLEIKEDPKKMMVSYLMIEKIEHLVIDEQNNYKIYQLLEISLANLKTSQYPQVILLLFEIKLLYLLGIGLSLQKCCCCGNPPSYFSVTLGGAICSNCGLTNPYQLNPYQFQLLKIIYYIKFDSIDDQLNTMIENQYQELSQCCHQYYEQYLGFKSKSRKIYQCLNEKI